MCAAFRIWVRHRSPCLSTPLRKESFKYFSRSHRNSTIALRVENFIAVPGIWVGHRLGVTVQPFRSEISVGLIKEWVLDSCHDYAGGRINFWGSWACFQSYFLKLVFKNENTSSTLWTSNRHYWLFLWSGFTYPPSSRIRTLDWHFVIVSFLKTKPPGKLQSAAFLNWS